MSVAASPLREVDGVPAVGHEVQELDRAEEGHRDRGESESPRARVRAEFKTNEDEAEPVLGSRASEL